MLAAIRKISIDDENNNFQCQVCTFDFSTGQFTYGQRKNIFPLPKSEPLDRDSHLAYMYLYAQEGSGQKGGSGKTCASCWENSVFGTGSESTAPSLWRDRE